MIYTQRIFLRINWWKNFENRSTFVTVIIKHQMAFFLSHIVQLTQWQPDDLPLAFQYKEAKPFIYLSEKIAQPWFKVCI